MKSIKPKSNSAKKEIILLLIVVILLAGCSLFDEQAKVVKNLEIVINDLDTNKFKELYVNPNNITGIDEYKDGTFSTLRKVCDGRVYFKILNKIIISDDKSEITANMYCDGAVDFKKLGQHYENAVRQEAKKDNLIDQVKIVFVQKRGKWFIENFDW